MSDSNLPADGDPGQQCLRTVTYSQSTARDSARVHNGDNNGGNQFNYVTKVGNVTVGDALQRDQSRSVRREQDYLAHLAEEENRWAFDRGQERDWQEGGRERTNCSDQGPQQEGHHEDRQLEVRRHLELERQHCLEIQYQEHQERSQKLGDYDDADGARQLAEKKNRKGRALPKHRKP